MISEDHLKAAVDERLVRDESPEIQGMLEALEIDEVAYRSVAAAFAQFRAEDAAVTREHGQELPERVIYLGGFTDGFVVGVIAARREAHG